MTITTRSPAPAFYAGDVPPNPLTWALEAEEPLDWVTSASATFRAADGTETTGTAAVDAENMELSVTLPTALQGPGLGYVHVTLTGGGRAVTLAPLPLVLEDASSPWASLGMAWSQWEDAPTDPALLWSILESARTACEAFAPASVLEVEPLPASYLRAQLSQAQGVYQSMRGTRDGGELGSESYAVPVFPLDWHVKQMLRPRTGVPVIG